METHLSSIWNKVIAEIKPTVSEGNFGTLLKPTQLLSLTNGVATVGAPSPIIINMLQERFMMSIKLLIEKHAKEKSVTVVFVPQAMTKPTKRKATPDEAPLLDIGTIQKPTGLPFAGHLPRVRTDYTFDNFAVSGSNQLAFVSSTTVAKTPGKSYNPLFIYGPVGVGKTHLMHAIANEVYVKNPDRKIIYITSEEFTNEVVEAIRHNETSKMKRRFRSAQLLLIDDIQFIEGKEKVQEELFHTFNILIDGASQIVLSSDRPPQDIKKLEKRLSSRFAGGLAVDIGLPDFELKTAIALIKAKKFGYELPIEVAKFLSENAQDTRSLEGLLLRLITQSTTTDKPMSIEMAQNTLKGAAHERNEHVHPDDVLNYVCEYYRIKPTQLKGPKRDASLVRARHIAMYILYKDLKLTLKDIGGLLGGRDHTTIMHGVEKIEKTVDKKSELSEDIMGITKLFRG
ncbi:MAG TPA: chromosomal replication initiator protein DnaA [Candidatus Saccharimonadales bacterium]|nr:chromosomal replication initiator protein DnaA [Candidatus Saccharimonadales bacterium]